MTQSNQIYFNDMLWNFVTSSLLGNFFSSSTQLCDSVFNILFLQKLLNIVVYWGFPKLSLSKTFNRHNGAFVRFWRPTFYTFPLRFLPIHFRLIFLLWSHLMTSVIRNFDHANKKRAHDRRFYQRKLSMAKNQKQCN